MRGASVQASRASIASTPRGAQVFCVVILSNGRVVSGSYDNTLKVWDVSKGECLRTLSGHIDSVRRQRPFEPRVDCSSSTPQLSQVRCVAALRNGDIVSGSGDHTFKVWEDTEKKMARLIALRRTQTNFVGRAIAEFL